MNIVYGLDELDVDKMADEAFVSIGQIPEDWHKEGDGQPYCFWAGSFDFCPEVCLGGSSMELTRDTIINTSIQVLERVLEKLRSGTIRVVMDEEAD